MSFLLEEILRRGLADLRLYVENSSNIPQSAENCEKSSNITSHNRANVRQILLTKARNAENGENWYAVDMPYGGINQDLTKPD